MIATRLSQMVKKRVSPRRPRATRSS